MTEAINKQLISTENKGRKIINRIQFYSLTHKIIIKQAHLTAYPRANIYLGLNVHAALSTD